MKYRVHARVVGSKYIGEFEAGSKEEAIQMAFDSDKGSCSVCHHCSREIEDPELQITEDDVEEIGGDA